ncbi:Hypothetical protein, putative [Bodo saltans]|uniref:Protein kinase domain-containing protein n=1 Tax=Bodo saltans TaxID=75058 RepID=A0A0S4KHN7_BODSA|nr:Hypothetical protein, putative [Bodo saltans]|eukprot:CUI13359.1 Hypothetical protein, putative [Bodo saltans]
MSFFLRAIGLGGNSIPNFNFTLGEEIEVLRGYAAVPWVVRAGTRNEDGSKVTIFEFNANSASSSSATMDMARNVSKRAKTLMLPGFLRCYDSVEYNNTIYVATEECLPLVRILGDPEIKRDYYDEESGERFDEGVALGLRHVSQALVALHKHQLVHGNVSNESVFVVKSGEWRLFGLELVAGHNEENGLYRRYWSILPDYRRPPETLTSSGGSSTSPAIHNVDAWGLGALIFSVYSGLDNERLSVVKGSDMRSCRTMPRTLQSGFTGLTGTNPKLRMPIDKFLTDAEFVSGSEYVLALQQLDELALKDATDRDAVYRHLTTVMDMFPLRACKYIILAKLSAAMQFGGGSATALEPILKIGTRLTDPVVFGELVAPIVMTLFLSQDPMVRLRLLSSAAQYAPLLPVTLVNDKIWAPFSTGFNSTNANLRELTVRALVHFVPLLDEKIISSDVIRYVTALQQDREGPIRTNATICLCLIADHIPVAIRPKTLVHGFGRMLRDPFLPSRLAALRSFQGTTHHLTPQLLAEAVIPGVAPLSLDANSEVRDLVFRVMDASLESLKKHAGTIPVAVAADDSQQAATSNPNSGVASPVSAGPATTAAAPAAAAGSFWGSWGGKSASTGPAATANGTAVNNNSIASASSSGSNNAPSSATAVKPLSTATPKHQDATTSSYSAPVVPAPTSSSSATTAGGSGGNSWEDELDFGESKPAAVSSLRPSSSLAATNSGMKLKKKGFGGGGAAKVE